MPLILDALLVCVGAYWLFTSLTTLQMWKGISIGNALIPTAASGIFIILLLIHLIGIIRKERINKEYFLISFQAVAWKEMIPLGIGVASLAGTYLAGIMLMMALMLFCWLKFLSGYKPGYSALVTAVVMACIYGIFKLWLKLPLPQGLLGIL